MLDRTPVPHRDDLDLLSSPANHLALGLELSARLSEDSSSALDEVSDLLADLGRMGAAEQQTAVGAGSSTDA